MITQRNLTFERLNEFYGRIKKNTLKGSSLAFAGGAVRDIFCNRPVKDFDIFIQTPTSWDDDSCTAGEEIEETITALNRLFYSTATEKGSVSVAEARLKLELLSLIQASQHLTPLHLMRLH